MINAAIEKDEGDSPRGYFLMRIFGRSSTVRSLSHLGWLIVVAEFAP